MFYFSDLEILEIHQKINNQQGSNTAPDKLNISKQKQPNQNEPPTSENRKTTQPNKTEQTLSQEHKINLENVKRIMNSEKNNLPSLRNIEWRTLKIEMNKIDQVLTYISTNNITELNELIYAGTKISLESPQNAWKKSKPGWEIQLEMQIKNLW